jgi:predicted transcriptional regulator
LGTYRGKLDIIADILKVASQNSKKTQIMYQANLSFRVLQKYLAELSDASLISFEDETRCYSLTAKGQGFLEAYKHYSRTSIDLEKKAADVNAQKQTLERLFNR